MDSTVKLFKELVEFQKMLREEAPELFSCLEDICKVFVQYKNDHPEIEDIKTPIDHIKIETKELDNGSLDVSFVALDEIGNTVLEKVNSNRLQNGTNKN